CSAAQSALFLPLSMPFIHIDTPAEHPLRKGRRQFSPRRGSEFRPRLPTKPPPSIRHPPWPGLNNRTFLLRHAARPCAGAGQSHPYAHAVPARAAPDTLFGEPGGLCFTPAPNVLRLGQARGARQALVRKSESSTKCGDCGDE